MWYLFDLLGQIPHRRVFPGYVRCLVVCYLLVVVHQILRFLEHLLFGEDVNEFVEAVHLVGRVPLPGDPQVLGDF